MSVICSHTGYKLGPAYVWYVAEPIVLEDSMIECKELVGKVIRQCNLFEDGSDGPELQLDFTDGTSFVASLKTRVALEAKCIQNDGGEPRILKDYTALVPSR